MDDSECEGCVYWWLVEARCRTFRLYYCAVCVIDVALHNVLHVVFNYMQHLVHNEILHVVLHCVPHLVHDVQYVVLHYISSVLHYVSEHCILYCMVTLCCVPCRGSLMLGISVQKVMRSVFGDGYCSQVHQGVAQHVVV